MRSVMQFESSSLGRLLDSLMLALKEKDPITYTHCLRVATLAKNLAIASGWSEEQCMLVEKAALLHDLGKIGVPDAILNKPSKLNEEEEAIMRLHPEKSVEILKPVWRLDAIREIIPGILHHHERIDGKGYPACLLGNDIPVHSRLILVADTFDAMTTDRPYRNGLSEEQAYQELIKYSGSQFDSEIVKAFVKFHPSWKQVSPDEEDDSLLPFPGYNRQKAA